jgi:hypothetical protein
MRTILSSIFGGFLADFPGDFRTQVKPIVDASVEMYSRISEELLPTPAKSHYVRPFPLLCSPVASSPLLSCFLLAGH